MSDRNRPDNRSPDAGAAVAPSTLSVLAVDEYVARGRALRAAYTAGLARRLWMALLAPVRRLKTGGTDRAERLDAVETEFKTSLTSIRSAAEILRDNADLPTSERNRFLDVVLADNRRLERAVEHVIFDAQRRRRRSRASRADALVGDQAA